MALKLKKKSYEWALKHLLLEGDTDLLPAPFEFSVIKKNWKTFLPELRNIDMEQYQWHPVKKYLVPKDQFAFRLASQLEPIDALILAALLRECGDRIDRYRSTKSKNIAFSYWFDPQPSGLFYGSSSAWHNFWAESKTLGLTAEVVAVADISDFYNQIYHHVVENQLDECLPASYATPIKRFLKSFENKVSRGIPVGPHASHILAELSLVPFDEAFAAHGAKFIRYVDDIHVYCESEGEAQTAIFTLAASLDRQQKLVLNKQKTKVLPAADHVRIATTMLVDQPLNHFEEDLLQLIKKYSGDDPYHFVSVSDLSDEDFASIDVNALEDLLRLYLQSEEKPYPRLGWLLRRLAQIGAPHAVDFVVDNFSQLIPIVGVASRYLLRAKAGYLGDLVALGDKLTILLDLPIVQASEYLQIVVLSLFYEIPELNHFKRIAKRFDKSSDSVKRGIFLAASSAKSGAWIREKKDELASSSPMTKRALLFAAGSMPGDESHIWVKGVWGKLNGLEQACYLAGAGKKTALKLGAKLY